MKFIKQLLGLTICCLPLALSAQTQLPLNNLDAFTTQSNVWSIVGDVTASIEQRNAIKPTPGVGVLYCAHDQKEYGTKYDLFTKEEYGDMDLSLEFMMARGSNSGIYLQGRYEVQLNDSWGVKNPKFSDCGGIYQRRDTTKPSGQNQYEGYAPRFNAYRAPGLWNSLDISYQAPRFDASGNKISNAKILYIKMNGVVIHENVELSGPTGGPVAENEVPFAPLRIQGDHGSVAFKNIVINNFNKKQASISDLSYKVYYGSYLADADLSKLKINEQGKIGELTWEVTKEPNNYVFVIEGKYHAPTSGDYTFVTELGGNSYLKIDGKEVLGNVWTNLGKRTATVHLDAGTHNFEIFNNKRDAWVKSMLGFWSAGPGFRLMPHHAAGAVVIAHPKDPIIVEANNNVNLRSFMDWKKEPTDMNFRVVHAISIGSIDGLHYTYDLDKGAIIQAWKGPFLDTSPMWDDRGDGSSKPLGSLTFFDHDLLLNPTGESTWKSDTTGTSFRPLGYSLDEQDRPTFQYKFKGKTIADKIRVVEGKYLDREIKLSNASGIVARIANGKNIEEVSPNLFAVDNKTYYIKLEKGADAVLLNKQSLLVKPQDNIIQYAIIY